MKLSKVLEKFCYCALMVLLASVLMGLTVGVWLAIFGVVA